MKISFFSKIIVGFCVTLIQKSTIDSRRIGVKFSSGLIINFDNWECLLIDENVSISSMEFAYELTSKNIKSVDTAIVGSLDKLRNLEVNHFLVDENALTFEFGNDYVIWRVYPRPHRKSFDFQESMLLKKSCVFMYEGEVWKINGLTLNIE